MLPTNSISAPDERLFTVINSAFIWPHIDTMCNKRKRTGLFRANNFLSLNYDHLISFLTPFRKIKIAVKAPGHICLLYCIFNRIYVWLLVFLKWSGCFIKLFKKNFNFREHHNEFFAKIPYSYRF